MRGYTNNDLKDVFESHGMEETLCENIDIDHIEDEDVRDLCESIKEQLLELREILDQQEFPEDENYED